MRRTNSLRKFVVQHKRLLWFLILPIIGCVSGLLLYPSLSQTLPAEWLALIPLQPVQGTFPGLFTAWLSSCFQMLCLLLLLFLSGLSAGGMPIAVIIPLFWGIGLGMTEAYYVQQGLGGLLVLATVLLPPSIIKLVALLMACSESLRLSLLIMVQLLPRAAHCGGLWRDFRMFGARFLLLLMLTLGAGVLDVLLRLALRGIL